MKKVLSLLVIYVFLQTETWALSGGPVFSNGTATNYVGSYAGVLIPEGTVTGTAAVVGAPSASIGLFSVAQPDAGVATGALLMFINGTAFNGNITGLIDPQDGTFHGIIDAQSSFNVVFFVPQTTTTATGTTTTFTREEFPVFAQGSLEAQVSFLTGTSQAPVTTQTGGTATPARIRGTASVDVFFEISNNGTPIITKTSRFDLDGFKQSDTTTSTTTFSFGQNFNTGSTTAP